ncbi:MAG: hypothetical protein ABI268_00035 [Rhodanobacter sp.]
MNMPRFLPALLAILLTAPAWAQSASKPLNLKLPPSSLPASSSSSPANSNSTAAATPGNNTPGVYYGDTSGRMGNTEVAIDDRPACDDSTYNKPQVHGSVGMGVVGGNHISGNYQTGTVNVSKAFGSCDDPAGGISISVGTGTGNFHSRGH